jgi:hypothetical protein
MILELKWTVTCRGTGGREKKGRDVEEKERKKKRKSGGEGVFTVFPVAEGQEGTGGDEF